MSAKTRSPEDWISFLLTVIDSSPEKPDWNKVAADTGAYKSGKFVQAYANLRKKYGLMPNVNGGGSIPATPSTPKSAKKRTAKDADLGDGGDVEEKPKSARKRKTPKKEAPKEDSDDETKVNGVKAEGSDDELSGNVTVGEEESGDQD